MKWKNVIWPVVGLAAVAVSVWLLYHELRGVSFEDVQVGLAAIPAHRWILAGVSSLIAYLALAGYDQMALNHIGKRVSWLFVAVSSFTAYALSHNIGGSVLSGAVIRYRAYATRGLSAQEVGMLVAFCSLTFALSVVAVSGIVLLLSPDLLHRFADFADRRFSLVAGLACLTVIAAYVFGSWLHFKPRRIAGFRLQYPRLPVVLRQFLIGPVELLAAAAIIYFALPDAGNPGYVTVLGIFLVSFSAALISHAPGGLGVLEVVFLTGLSEMDPVAVLSALLVFRLFYLIVPLILAIFVVLGFERKQYSDS